jgi:hypothetical protein
MQGSPEFFSESLSEAHKGIFLFRTLRAHDFSLRDKNRWGMILNVRQFNELPEQQQ